MSSRFLRATMRSVRLKADGSANAKETNSFPVPSVLLRLKIFYSSPRSTPFLPRRADSCFGATSSACTLPLYRPSGCGLRRGGKQNAGFLHGDARGGRGSADLPRAARRGGFGWLDGEDGQGACRRLKWNTHVKKVRLCQAMPVCFCDCPPPCLRRKVARNVDIRG